MPTETLRQPSLEPPQCTSPAGRTPVANVATLGHVAPDRHVAASELPRNPLDPPTQRLQSQHRRDLVRRPHLVSPQDLRPQHTLTFVENHLDPPGPVIQRVQFSMSSGVQFYMSPDNEIEALLHGLLTTRCVQDNIE